MTAEILVARARTTELFVKVHIDTSKPVSRPWLMEFRFPLPRPEGMTQQDYLAQCRDRMRAAITVRLDRLADDSEGTDLGLAGQEP